MKVMSLVFVPTIPWNVVPSQDKRWRAAAVEPDEVTWRSRCFLSVTSV